MFRRRALLLLLLLGSLPATATTVYKCSGRNGAVIYQGTPCAPNQHQQTLQLSDQAPAPASTVAAAVAPSPAPDEAPIVAPPPLPAAPLPMMYRCVRATDGKSYLSRNGDTQPYLAPLGMLGVLPSSLAQTYSAANRMGKGKPSAALVANNYTWVQDECRELSPQETCRTLHDAWDENEQKLQRAFQSDQPPLLKREAELRAQLTNC